MAMHLRRVLFVAAIAVTASLALALAAPTPRQVSCTGTKKIIPPAGLRAYQTFFREFNSTTLEGMNAGNVNFEALDGLATAMGGGVDVGEMLVGVNQVTAAWDGTIGSLHGLWNATWGSRAEAHMASAESLLAKGYKRRAARTFRKASAYFQLAERFMDHLSETALNTYNNSLVAFARAINTDPTTSHWCELSPVPYTDSTGSYLLHAYMCRPGARGTTDVRPTLMAMGGYDSSAELSYYESGVLGLEYGYNMLLFDGPGQGATVRFQNIHFRPDWEFVVDQVIKHVITLPGVNASNLALWGRSFGGYLTPRACAYEPRLLACVADGGVLDFYQSVVCSLDDNLRDLYYNDQPKFNKYLKYGANFSLGARFLLSYGKLGFASTSPSDLLNQFSAYTNVGQLGGLTGRPVFVNNPPFDTLVGNQSELFYAALPRPLSPATVLYSDNPEYGTALHCSVGSDDTTYAILDWLSDVFGFE